MTVITLLTYAMIGFSLGVAAMGSVADNEEKIVSVRKVSGR